MEKPLSIIGLDPGTTAAYSVLDLKGALLQTYSAKQLPLSQIISQIISLTQPLITSTDKEAPPSLVQEFSAQLGTLLFHPSQDLKKEEKKDLTAPYLEQFQGHHQLDSLAAALYAYKKFRPTLDKIDRFLQTNNLESLRNPFTQLVLKENLNFELAKALLTAPQKEEAQIIQKVIQDSLITKTDFLKLYQKLDQAKKEKLFLENRITQLKKTLRTLQQTNLFLAKSSSQAHRRIDTLFQFKEKRLKDFSQEIHQEKQASQALHQKIASLYSFISQVPRYQLFKKLNNLSQKEFEEKNKILNIQENDFLYILHPHIYSEKIIEQLKDKNILILSPEKPCSVIKHHFVSFQLPEPLISDLIANDYFALLPKQILEKQLAQRNLLPQIIEEYQKERQKEN